MKYINTTLLAAALFVFSTTIASAQILAGGESWSAFEELNFESDSDGIGLRDMQNDGSNAGTWSTNSVGGKFVADANGFAVTDGDAGTWARSISYSTPIDSGKWRLVLDVGAYDFTTFDGMTGVNDLSLELIDNGLSVAKVSFRIHDDVGGDGVADQTQLAIQINGNGSNNSAFSGKDSDMTATDNQIWDFVAIEFDFLSGNILLERNGVVVRETGLLNKDPGTITFSQFDELRLSANGDWASTTADTGVLNTDLIGLYTAVPEPSTYALIGGFVALGLVLLRRRLR